MLTQANIWYSEWASARHNELEEMTDLESWATWLESLNELGREALTQAMAELPDASLFESYTIVDNLLADVDVSDDADHRWVAASRNWMADSAKAARCADFDEAFTQADRARDKLNWLLGRRRNSARSNRQLSPRAASDISESLTGIGVILGELAQARRVLA